MTVSKKFHLYENGVETVVAKSPKLAEAEINYLVGEPYEGNKFERIPDKNKVTVRYDDRPLKIPAGSVVDFDADEIFPHGITATARAWADFIGTADILSSTEY